MNLFRPHRPTNEAQGSGIDVPLVLLVLALIGIALSIVWMVL